MVDRVTFAPAETGPTAPTPEPDANRPEWLDPKFESPEKQAQAYADLQSKFTTQAQELAKLKGTAPVDGETTPDATPDAEGSETKPDDDKSEEEKKDDAAKAAAEAAGLNLTSYSEEFSTTGDVAPEKRQEIIDALSKTDTFKGLDVASLVNDYIDGKKALVSNDQSMFMDAAGGADQYGRMMQWAAEKLPPEQQAVFNKAVESGDRHATMFAIEGLKAKFEAANGRDATPLKGSGVTPTTSGYKSSAEMQADMRKPEYKNNPAFRQKVAEKLAASNF